LVDAPLGAGQTVGTGARIRDNYLGKRVALRPA